MWQLSVGVGLNWLDEEWLKMRILIVASYNKQRFAPFIEEQADALRKAGVEVEYYGVVGKGIWGYLKTRKSLIQKIRDFQPDVIHAHYGLCGLLANLQRKVPVVTTYHGSDINVPKILRFSKIAMRLSKWNIFVSQRNVDIVRPKKHFALLPCGVNLENFIMRTREHARKTLGWNNEEKKILFTGAFDNKVKNATLAQEAVGRLSKVELVELKGYNREQMANLFYAADALLMTSFTEGSPQVIKEAMACSCPIVSVDVGDVAERIAGLDKCYIAERTSEDIAAKLQLVLQDTCRTQGREQLLAMGLDNKQVAEKLIVIYKTVQLK